MPAAIKEIRWSAEAEEGLEVAARGDLEIIRKEVLSGISRLWECTSESSKAFIVTRVDDETEVCIVAGEGSGFVEFIPALVKFWRDQGYTIRVHVKRRGLVKMFEKVGIRFDEYVLRG